MIYHNLSDTLHDEEKYELSLQNALYSLYFSTNLASKYYLFSLENVRFDGIETAKSRIDSESTFNPHIIARILELTSTVFQRTDVRCSLHAGNTSVLPVWEI